jgi:hypothetical protein
MASHVYGIMVDTVRYNRKQFAKLKKVHICVMVKVFEYGLDVVLLPELPESSINWGSIS